MQLFKYLLQIHFSPFLPASRINTFVSSVSVDMVMLLKACITNMQHKGYVSILLCTTHIALSQINWYYLVNVNADWKKNLQTGDVTEIGADFPALNCSYHNVVKEEEY